MRWGPVIAWAGVIFYLSSLSALPDAPPGVTDKHAHLAVYAVLAACLVWAVTDRAPGRTSWATVGVVVLVATLYGVSDEWHQSFVPGREVSAADVAADAAGALLAAGGLRAWAIIRARR